MQLKYQLNKKSMTNIANCKHKIALPLVCLLLAISLGLIIPILENKAFAGLVMTGLLSALVFSVIFFLVPIWGICIYLLVVAGLQFFEFQIGGQAVHVDLLVSSLMILVGAFLIVQRRMPLMATRIQRSLVCMLLLFLPSMLFSISLAQSLKVWMRFVSYYVMLTLITSSTKNAADSRRVLWSVALASLVPSIVGIYGFLTSDPNFVMATEYYYGNFKRVQSLMSHPNTFGYFLAITLIAQIVMWVIERRFVRRIVLTLLIILSGANLVMTFSRTPLVLFIVALSLVLILLKRRKTAILFILVIILIILFVPAVSNRWTDILDSSQGNSLTWRISLWKESLSHFVQVWFMGSGIGTFIDFVQFESGYASHSMYVGFLIETGIVGLLGVIQFFVFLMIESQKYLRRYQITSQCDVDIFIASIVSFALCAAILASSIAGSPLNLPSAIVYFFAIAGVLSSKSTLSKQKSSVVMKGGVNHGVY